MFDAQFMNTDKMVLVAKRSEMDNFQFKISGTFLEQLLKWEEMVSYYIELGGKISDDDKCYLLIKALPPGYKMKLSNILSLSMVDNACFQSVKTVGRCAKIDRE